MSLFQEYELDLDPGEKDTIEANVQPGYWHVYPRASIGSGGVRLCNGPSIKAGGSKEIVGLMSIRLPGRDTKITLENRSSAAVHLFITAARGFHISVERLDPGSGGGGASTFLDLTDSPASYVGQAAKRASVKSAEDGLEFTAEPTHTFPDLTDVPASYSGQAAKRASVKSAEDGLEFTAEPTHTFPDLTDSPASYSGQAGKVAAVKATEDGLEFIAGGAEDIAMKKLSESTDGKGIKVAAVATPGTTIHTAAAGTSTLDEVWIYAVNTGAVDRKLTIQWGGVATPDDLIEVTVTAEAGLLLITPGLVLQNSKVVKAFAAAADEIIIHGHVITRTIG